MFTRLFSLSAALCLTVVVGCGDDSGDGTGGDGSTSGASTTTSGGTTTAASGASTGDSSGTSTTTGGGEGGAGGEGGSAPGINGCAEGDFVDGTDDGFDRTVLIGADGLVFTPKCLKIAAGQSVVFEGSLATHPLAPGNAADNDAGSPDNPIVETTTGSSVEFTFDAPGTYPYFCEAHGFGDGEGMSGAIEVE